MSDRSSSERRLIRREAVFWERRLKDPELLLDEFLRFVEWHGIAEHREMFHAVAARVDTRTRIRVRARTRQCWGSTVRVVAVLFILTILWPGNSSQQLILQTQDTTQALALADGSIVRAAPNTRVEIQLDSRRRALHLSRGHAFFHVAHDSTRPFVVHTPTAVVRALGTRFGISIRDHESLVSVIEGSVAVTAESPQITAPQSERPWIRVEASQQLGVSSQRLAFAFSEDDTQALAWATNIAFDEVPILMAVEQFSKRSGIRVEVKDPGSARRVSLSGGFQLDDPEGFARLVAQRASTTVLLHRPGSVVHTITP